MLLATLRPENAPVCVCAHRWTWLFCYEASASCPGLPAKRPEWKTTSQCSVLRRSS